jgi:hypothetical protein
MSMAEWVRQALDLTPRREPGGGVGKKLEVVRAAVRQHDYPSGDIDGMLAEIESGYPEPQRCNCMKPLMTIPREIG